MREEWIIVGIISYASIIRSEARSAATQTHSLVESFPIEIALEEALRLFSVCVFVCGMHTYIYIYATCKRIGVNLADRINLLNLQDKKWNSTHARRKVWSKWNSTNEKILKGMIKEEGLLIEEKKRSKEEDVSSTRQAAKLTPLRQRVGRREHRITIYKRIWTWTPKWGENVSFFFSS